MVDRKCSSSGFESVSLVDCGGTPASVFGDWECNFYAESRRRPSAGRAENLRIYCLCYWLWWLRLHRHSCLDYPEMDSETPVRTASGVSGRNCGPMDTWIRAAIAARNARGRDQGGQDDGQNLDQDQGGQDDGQDLDPDQGGEGDGQNLAVVVEEKRNEAADILAKAANGRKVEDNTLVMIEPPSYLLRSCGDFCCKEVG
ncbi:hypothetical protein ACH5RR_023828 [Cinchona calisaya]|uniref:Uncharacterized protein n=1 Tax=Cinchona calisaya TaxID=153742 RepID=A0ABD2ZDM3_9GENT